MKKDILSLMCDELKEEIISLNLKGYRAEQVFSWLHKKGVKDFEQMSDISVDDRETLKDNFYVKDIEIITKNKSKRDKTVKYLFSLGGGEAIETVVMDYRGKKSICVSTQVGCRMGCTFCASSKVRFVRNLEVSELLGQVYGVVSDLKSEVSNITLMGIGEPLENFDNVLKFIYILNDKRGKNISLRRITLSTCGICDMIDKLAECNLGITLAVSLHASCDSVRNRIMPINKRYNLDNLLKSCYNYANSTKRRITFEYICLKGINDGIKDAVELGKILKPILCHVNLLWYNNVKGDDFETSGKNLKAFENALRRFGVSVTVRRRLGKDVNAACGQLRRKNVGGI